MSQAELATRIIEASLLCGFLTTTGLAKHLKVSKAAVVGAYDTIEAAGYRVMRIGGVGGGIEVRKPLRAKREAK